MQHEALNAEEEVVAKGYQANELCQKEDLWDYFPNHHWLVAQGGSGKSTILGCGCRGGLGGA
jgi:hypothetical protein